MVESNKAIHEYKKKFQEKKIEDLDQLDLFKCKDIKLMAQADERLFLDKEFLENKIRPCRDELTKIYIDTYYSMPYQAIAPNWKNRENVTITSILNVLPNNSAFTKATSNAMKDTLMTMGIMNINHGYFRLNSDMYHGLPMDNWYLLSQFYRWAISGRRTILTHSGLNPKYNQYQPGRHPKNPYITGILVDEENTRIEISGREALEYTLNLFEETVRVRHLKMPGRTEMTDNDIEKMKRYFILCLIGIKVPGYWGPYPHDGQYLDNLNRNIKQLNKNRLDKMAKGDWKKAQQIELIIHKLKLIKFNLKKMNI